MKKTIAVTVLLILSFLSVKAQDDSEYRTLDIKQINKELKNGRSFNSVLEKHCTYYPKDYMISGKDSYNSSSIGPISDVKMHLRDITVKGFSEVKINYKTTKKNGYLQLIKLEESFLCKGALEWNAIPCNDH